MERDSGIEKFRDIPQGWNTFFFSKGRKSANVYVLALVQKEPAGQPVSGSHSGTTKAMSEARGQEAGN